MEREQEEAWTELSWVGVERDTRLAWTSSSTGRDSCPVGVVLDAALLLQRRLVVWSGTAAV